MRRAILLLATCLAPLPALAQTPFHQKDWFPGQTVTGKAESDMGAGTTYELQNAPSWLAIDPGSGTISGTLPQGAAPAPGIVVRARKNDAVSVSDPFALKVATPEAMVMGGNSVAPVEGNPVSFSATTNLPNATWTLSGAPSWLTVNGNVFSGTHTGDISAPQAFNVTATASSGGASTSTAIPFTVVPGTTSVSLSKTSAFAGQTITGTTSTTLGAGATYSLVNAPPWLGINAATGALSGTATGTASGFVVRATKNGAIADSPSLSVTAATPTASATGPTVYEGAGVSFTATTNLPSPSWSLVGAPAWLAINAAGTVSGTAPATAGAYTGTARAADGGATANAPFTVTVVAHDTTPNDFGFTALSGQTPGAVVYSNAVTIAGISTAVPVSVTGNGAQVSVAGGAWTTAASIANGQSLQLRMTASGGYDTALASTVSVGALARSWTVSTRGPVCNGGGDNAQNAEYYYYYAPDVRNAGVNAFVHWAKSGWAEGRSSCYTLYHCDSAGGSVNSTANRELYYHWNPDVRAAGVDPYNHWIYNGYAEGRTSCWGYIAPPVTPGGQTFTSTTNWAVPQYNTMTVKVWGAGGGGGGQDAMGVSKRGATGGLSDFLGLTARGALGGMSFEGTSQIATGGAGGTASGGSTNTTGGKAPDVGLMSSTTGGTSARGSYANGSNGGVPGGGGGGCSINNWTAGSGGGGGGYVAYTYTRGAAGAPVPGGSVTVTVGAGGAGGGVANPACRGGNGARGEVEVTWN